MAYNVPYSLQFENGSESSTESINGSWVKLDGSRIGQSLQTSPKLSDEEDMEKLLADAFDDQSKQSLINNEDTHSPRSDEKITVSSSLTPPQECVKEGRKDWVQAWASRPEQTPPGKMKMKHPSEHQSPSFSIRRTKIMKSGADILRLNLTVVIPALILTHAVTLGIGFYLGSKSVSKIVN